MTYTAINKNTDNFNTVTYVGNGSTTQTITGVGFQPDWSWIKNRSTTNDHNMYDVVRGQSKRLEPNNDLAEADIGADFTFQSDGFYVGDRGDTNGNGNNIVGWNWKAGGSGSANTDGSINSTVSANTTAGFSIVKWTAYSNGTVGHGLGQKPAMIICKSRTNSAPWLVWHKDLTGGSEEDRYIILSTTAAQSTYTDYWGTGGFTNQVFGVNADNLNNNIGDMIGYVFAEKTGYSKFGSLTGNGSTDGTFVYCGFAPAFILVKAKTSGNWFMYDNKRPGYNNVQQFLEADGNTTEYTSNANHSIDILSNGFKFTGGSGSNTSDRECIFMAFGQSLVGSNNVPCTAR